MDCRVVVEAAVPVYDVQTPDEAVRISISKTGEMLNPDLNYVEINMGDRTCPHCGDALEPAFIAADEALVALELEMTVFNVEREEHASRIARKEIGQRLKDIPLRVLSVDPIDETDDEPENGDEAQAAEPARDSVASSESDGTSTRDEEPGADVDSTTGEHDEDEDVLPDFEDLIE